MIRPVLVALAAASALVTSTAAALPPLKTTPGYRFASFDVPGAASQSYLTSINDAGIAVGAYDDKAGNLHAVVRRADGTYTTFDKPGARSTISLGINNSGAISGTFIDTTGHQHGFVRSPGGQFETIDFPGAVYTTYTSEFGAGIGSAVGTINDDGTIVGEYSDAAGTLHGVIRHPDGTLEHVDAPGASKKADPLFRSVGGTIPISVNEHGTLAGAYFPAKRGSLSPVDTRGFVRIGGAYKTLAPPGVLTSQAFAVAEDDTVGGVAFDTLGFGLTGYGFLWKNGAYKRIDPVKLALLSTVADINRHGVISGEYETLDLKIHGYIGVPR